MTRVAASDPDLWTAVCDHNRDAVLTAIDGLQAQLETMRQAVESKDRETLRKQLSAAADRRTEWFDAYTERREKTMAATEPEDEA